MPLYEYECSVCGHRVEVIQRVGAAAPECPECGGGTEKLLSAPAFQFKGSGWYVTDYARKGEKGSSSSASGAAGDGGATSSADAGSGKAESTKPSAKPSTSD